MDRLRLTVPVHSVWHRAIGGTESSIYNLVRGLAASRDCDLQLLLPPMSRLSPEFAEWVTTFRGETRSYRIPGTRSVRFLEETIAPFFASNADWIVYPNYFMSPLRLRRKQRSAVILHDIQYKLYPHFFSFKRRHFYDVYLPHLFRTADAVLLISEFERNQVRTYFGEAAASKCRVIYNGIDFDRFDTGTVRTDIQQALERNYLLAVFHPFPHKNLATLLKAFNRLVEERPDLYLYLVGAKEGAHTGMIGDLCSERARDRVVQLGFLSDRELGECYRKAAVFVHPSIYEGFGLPVLEAMGLGRKVVASGVSAIPEVSLGLATYVDEPLEPAKWVAAIDEALGREAWEGAEIARAVRARYSAPAFGERVIAQLRTVPAPSPPSE